MQNHPAADVFPMMAPAEHAALVVSMRTRGFDPTHPVLLFEGMILDGRNRMKAAYESGVTPTFAEWKGEDPWEFVWAENVVRRHLEAGQQAAIRIVFDAAHAAWLASKHAAANVARSEAAKVHAQVKPRAEGGAFVAASPGGTPRDVPPGPPVDRSQNRNLEPRTMQRARELQTKAPEQFARVVAGEVSLGKALGEVKLEAKRALAEEIRANPTVTPSGRYQVIVIDPPWKYDARAEDTTHRGKNLYPDMTIPEICALPVGALSQDNAVLWLWTTNAFMREAYTCLDAWGFQAKTILTWDKERLGLGDWLRNVTEHCILAVRGRPIVSLTNQTTIIREPRREHSRKPEAFYALVEALCPGSKVELFAREVRQGYAAWGAETTKFTHGGDSK